MTEQDDEIRGYKHDVSNCEAWTNMLIDLKRIQITSSLQGGMFLFRQLFMQLSAQAWSMLTDDISRL